MASSLKLTREVRIPARGLRINTLRDALDLIDRDLPKGRRHAPYWRRARECLTKAARSRDPDEIERATTQFERAMRQEPLNSMNGTSLCGHMGRSAVHDPQFDRRERRNQDADDEVDAHLGVETEQPRRSRDP